MLFFARRAQLHGTRSQPIFGVGRAIDASVGAGKGVEHYTIGFAARRIVLDT